MRLRCMTNASIVHRPTPYNVAPTGLYCFWHYIYIALMDYAMLYNTAPTGLHVCKPTTPTGWHYPTWSARAMSTNNIEPHPERATLPNMVREGYEHENMNMPVQDAIT